MFRIKCTAIIFLIPTLLFAQPEMQHEYVQKFTEIGIQTGLAGYGGDLGGPLGSKGLKNFESGLFRAMFNINATHRMSSSISFRPGLTIGKLAGDDRSLKSGSASDPGLSNRNLNFRSTVAELSLLADVNPLFVFSGYRENTHKFYPYMSAGIGLFYFNPQGNLDGSWENLRPLRLEGQGFPEYPTNKQYSKVQVSIPVGAGFKYYVSSKLYLGMEGMVRKTFTDYIDDVSTKYIDPRYFTQYLSPSNATLAGLLYNRYDEQAMYRPTVGSPRGVSKNKDYFFTLSIRAGIILNTRAF